VYQEYFGLTDRPFSETPNPKFFYLSSRHREGLAHLEFNILDGKGFTVLAGEVGTGKTTLCRTLMDRLDSEKVVVAHILHTNLDFNEFLREVVDELGIAVQGQQKWDLLKALDQYLIETYGRNRKVVLIVDEAQNLTPSVLEGIRMLSNLETPQDKLIQIVLVGQPALLEKIQRPDLLQLKQRIAGCYFLGPLSQKETTEYIAFRLSRVQDKPSLRFTSGAVNLVYELSCGIPRLINFLCDFSLVHAYVEETWTIDHFLVQKAHKDLKGSPEVVESRGEKEKKFQGRFYPGKTEGEGSPAAPFQKKILEMKTPDPEKKKAMVQGGGENFFRPGEKAVAKKIAVALVFLLTLGGIGSFFYWGTKGSQWIFKAGSSAYQIRMPLDDSGKDLHSRLLLSEKRFSRVGQEPTD
jgi:type II secretory pathway predicted ATPase ExeA